MHSQMKKLMSWSEVVAAVADARNKGYLATNFFPDERRVSEWCENGSFSLCDAGKGVFFIRVQNDFASLYYMLGDVSALSDTFVSVRDSIAFSRIVADVVGPEAIRRKSCEAFAEVGFAKISELVRMSRKTPECGVVAAGGVSDAHASDIPSLKSLFADNFNPLVEQLPSERELAHWIGRDEILVVRDDGGVAHSFVIFDLSPASLYLRYWFVSPQYRNQGVGSRLANGMFAKAVSTRRQYLWVITDNDNAIKRYEHYGFTCEAMRNVTLLYEKAKGPNDVCKRQ